MFFRQTYKATVALLFHSASQQCTIYAHRSQFRVLLCPACARVSNTCAVTVMHPYLTFAADAFCAMISPYEAQNASESALVYFARACS